MSGTKHDRFFSSSQTSQEREEYENIRRNEQWSSLDSCIIPNRTRLPSAKVQSDGPQSHPEDFQIALNLLRVESKAKPPDHRLSRQLSGQTRSTKVYSSIEEEPSEAQTHSRHTSTPSRQSTRRTCSSSSGSVIVHSQNLAALEELLNQHGLPHLHIDGCDEHHAHHLKVHGDLYPLPDRSRRVSAAVRKRSFPRPLCEHDMFPDIELQQLDGREESKLAAVKQNIPNAKRENHHEQGLRMRPIITRTASFDDLWSSNGLDVREKLNVRSQSSNIENRPFSGSPHLRPSRTCPTLRDEKKAQSGILRRSSKSALNLLRLTSGSPSKPLDRDHPLDGQTIQDLARKLGVNLIILPTISSPAPLSLPICFARPMNYLINTDASATEIFAAPKNHKMVDAYCLAYAELLKDVQQDSTILTTVAADDYPPEPKDRSRLTHAKRPAEIGASLITMLSDLPGGIMGSAGILNKLRVNMHAWRRNQQDLPRRDNRGLCRFVAKVIASIPNVLQVHLICALFGLMHNSKRREGDLAIMAHVVAPIMLNTQIDQVGLMEVVEAKHPRRRSLRGVLGDAWKKMMKIPVKDPVMIRRLGACEYVAGELLRMWEGIVKEMVGLDQSERARKVEDVGIEWEDVEVCSQKEPKKDDRPEAQEAEEDDSGRGSSGKEDDEKYHFEQ